MMVNETLARRLWPEYPGGANPIGLHVKEGYDKALGWIEVVGIVADIHEGGLADDAVAEFYLPCAMHPPQTAFVIARTEGDPMRLANAIRERVLAVDRDQPVSDVRTMEAVFEATLGQRRLTMLLLGAFAGVALLLATVGHLRSGGVFGGAERPGGRHPEGARSAAGGHFAADPGAEPRHGADGNRDRHGRSVRVNQG